MQSQLSLQKTNLSLVKKDHLKEVLSSFGLGIEEDGKTGEEILFKSDMDKLNEVSAKCEGCGVEMTLNNFGHLVHGSRLTYCKNPVCFNHFLAIKKIG